MVTLLCLLVATTPSANAEKILVNKCARCHGAEHPAPKKGIRITFPPDPKLVTTGNPDASPLWKSIKDDRMPPDEPLTLQEKEEIRNWIVLMKPSGVSKVGRFHILVVHFPIALILCALFAEAWGRIRPSDWQKAVVSFCIYVGTVGALAAVALGYVYSMEITKQIISHQRWGLYAALLCTVTSMARTYFGHSWIVTVLLVLTAVTTGYAAHLGGSLVHGADFLSIP
jgi:uncharacterized membrane protein